MTLKDYYTNTKNSLFNGVGKTGGTFLQDIGSILNPFAQTGVASRTRQLPNGAGTYSAEGTNPAPAVVPPPVIPPTKPVFSGGVATTPASTTAPTPQKRDPYINPNTGQYYTPQEYATAVATTLPVNKPVSGDVGKYAGDAITKPDQSTADLTKTATGLNNARNDMATGETDPYDVTQGGTIVYSPEERTAIEKAYAGIYDPAIDDVFAKLAEKKKEEDALASRELEKFRTDENIRQYNATTGKNAGGKGAKSVSSLGIQRGPDGFVNWQEYWNKAKEWEASGKSVDKFVNDYPPGDFINPADTGNLPAYLQPKTRSQSDRTAEAWAELTNPANAGLSDEDKYYYVASLGLNPENFGLYAPQ
jgi:hypothetical protein